MPSAPAATVQHAAFTDHSIPRRPRKPEVPPAEASLAPFPGSAATNRELGLGYATLALQDNNRVWGARAFELLRNETDAKSLDQLAQLTTGWARRTWLASCMNKW